MGKYKKQLEQNTKDFLAAHKDELKAGKPVAVSLLSVAQNLLCGNCGVKSVDNGGEAELKRCSRCMLAYYCSRECQVQD